MRLLLILLFSTFLSQAQTIRLGQFDEIKVFDGLRVTIIPSEVDSLVVEGENKEYLSVKNKNGRLYLRMKLRKKLSGFNTTIALFTSTPLEVIDANEGAFVSCQDVLFQSSIILKTQEGAEIDALLDVQKVSTKTISGGIVNLKGAAVIQNHRISAGGIVNGANLDSEQVTVKVKAGGKASIKASELVEANVSFGGSIRIYGDPKKTIKKIAVGGSIERIVSEAQLKKNE